jgi:alpha-N-arabinofuranosidase
MDGHNTFDRPDEVVPAAFTDFTVEGHTLRANLPPMSVTMLEIVSC